MSPTRTAIVVLALVAILALPGTLAAQSCVLTRLDTPVLNALDTQYNDSTQRWQVGFGWRYGYSFRHFVGTDEQEERLAEHSQVVNNVNLADLSVRFNFNSRTSVSLGVPYLSASRSGALRSGGQVVKRYTRSETSGIGDMTLLGKWLVWDPKANRRSNLALGLGVKLPTGDYRQKETRLSMVGGREVASSGIADYSVQPGDGGWGYIVEASGYKLLNTSGSLAGYGSGTYILEPAATNGVERPGAERGEEEVSATDQYVARLGMQLGPAAWRGFTVGLGGRIEGIPVHDLVGSSDGRRRPGYMISVEPSFSYTRGGQSVNFSMPWAVERNRQRSVADLLNGGHGDAAFPDYVVLSNYTIRF